MDTSFSSTASPAPDALLAGEFPRVTTAITLLSGEGERVAGSVLGKITASGKYVLSVAAAVDGSETPAGILVMDTDATAEDKETSMYRTGEFNEAALTFGAGHTADSVRAGLEALQIYLKPVTAA